MRVIITGGNGYIGARLSQNLASEGYEVIPICYPSIPESDEWKSKMFEIHIGDLRNENTIALISGLNPDIIIHLVSLDHFESEKDVKYVNDINVLPTWRLLDKCTKQDLKKFIYFSTIHVYGKLKNTLIQEGHPVKTSNAYGLTHYLSENICDYYNRKASANIITVRLSNSYGSPIFSDNNCWWLAINDLCRNAFKEKKIQLKSDGSPQRDFIHVNDVCRAIKKIIENDSKNIENNIYHISSGETLTILEIAQIIRKVYQNRYKQNLPIITPNNLVLKDDAFFNKYQISNEKLNKIGFAPLIDLQTGINELFDYLENNYV